MMFPAINVCIAISHSEIFTHIYYALMHNTLIRIWRTYTNFFSSNIGNTGNVNPVRKLFNKSVKICLYLR